MSVRPKVLCRVVVYGEFQAGIGKVIRCGGEKRMRDTIAAIGHPKDWCSHWVVCVQGSARDAHGCFMHPVAL